MTGNAGEDDEIGEGGIAVAVDAGVFGPTFIGEAAQSVAIDGDGCGEREEPFLFAEGETGVDIDRVSGATEAVAVANGVAHGNAVDAGAEAQGESPAGQEKIGESTTAEVLIRSVA